MTTNRTISDLARIWARYPVLWAVRVSGDGKWLAWSWTGLDDTGNVWIVDRKSVV